MAMSDALQRYQNDKKFEEYLLIKQRVDRLSKDVQVGIAKLLDYCYVQKKDEKNDDLMTILSFTQESLKEQH